MYSVSIINNKVQFLTSSVPATAAARVSETSGRGTVMATSSTSPDDPASTKILSELNLLAIYGMIWLLLHVNSF